MSTGAGVVQCEEIVPTFRRQIFLDARWNPFSDLGLDADNLYAGRFPGMPALRTLKPVLHSPREPFGSNLQRDCDVVPMNSVAFVEWFVGK